MHPILDKKLKELKLKYKEVSDFALLFPQYTSVIIDNELTGDCYCVFTERHGKLPLNWGVRWQVFEPTNYPEHLIETKPKGLVCVHIMCSSLFSNDLYHFASEELHKVLPDIISKCHFYDAMNSKFYFLPEELEEGLNKLEKWYTDTKAKVDGYLKEQRKKQLQAELDKLND